MIEIIARVNENKNLTLSKKVLGNKMDNSVTKVIFQEIAEVANLTNKYAAFLNPNNEIFLFPLKVEDNSFIVTQTLTKIAGTYSILYLSTTQEIDEEGNIPDTARMFISNATQFQIQDNFLDDSIEQVIVDENLKIVYEALEETIIYLNSEVFKEELINNLHITESDIELIANNIKNDEEFKEEVKGEPGPAGPKGENANTYDDYCAYHTFMTDNLPIPYKKIYLNDEILLNEIEALPPRTEIFRTNRYKYYFNSTDGNRIFWYGLDTEVGESNWWVDRLGFMFIHRENAGSQTDLWYFDYGQTTSNYYFEDDGFTTMISNPYLVATRTKILPPEEFAFQYGRGEQGEKGEKGDSFEYEDFTEEQLESLKGPAGVDGVDGVDGKDAYEVWLEDNPLNGTIEAPNNYIFDLKKDGDRVFHSKEEITGDTKNIGMVILLDKNGNAIDDRFSKFVFYGDTWWNELKINFIRNEDDNVGISTIQLQSQLSQDTNITINMMLNALKQEYSWTYPETAAKFRISNGSGETWFNLDSSWFACVGVTSTFDNSKDAYYESIKGKDGDTYTITENDYDAIADVVLSKMVNAEEVDY